jgi:hypothetical protein
MKMMVLFFLGVSTRDTWILPLLAVLPVFSPMSYVTVPEPVPEEPEAIVSHSLPEATSALQAQPVGVVTVKEEEPPDAEGV